MRESARKWWRAAGVRAVKTICQTAIASVGTAVALSELDVKYVVSAAVLAGILSVLTSLAGLPEVPDGSEGEKEDKEES